MCNQQERFEELLGQRVRPVLYMTFYKGFMAGKGKILNFAQH
jgi:hypothetical protein